MKRFLTDQDLLATIRRMRRQKREAGQTGHWSFWPFRRRLCIMDWLITEQHRLQLAGRRSADLPIRPADLMARYYRRKWN